MGARTTVLWAGLADRVFFASIAVLPLLSLRPGISPWLLVAALVCGYVCMELYNVGFNAWIGERVEKQEMGRFLAQRTLWANGSGVAALFLSGFALQAWDTGSGETAAAVAAAVIGIGCLFGFIGVGILRMIRPQAEPVKVGQGPGIRESSRIAFADPKFRHFLSFSLVWGFATQMTSPFFMALAVEGLGYSVGGTALLQGVHLGAGLLFLGFWGRLVDRFGSKPVIAGAGFWAAMTPLLWVLLARPESPELIYIAEAVSGIAWAGVNLAASHLLLRITPGKYRLSYLSIYTAVTGAVLAFAPILGGMLISSLTPWLGSVGAYKWVFGINGILRLLALLYLRGIRSDGDATLQHSARVALRAAANSGALGRVGATMMWIPSMTEDARRKTWRILRHRQRRQRP